MPDWRSSLTRLQDVTSRLPRIFWAAAGVILLSLGVALWLEMAGPPYAVLDDGLSPADGGKVIAQLQKLGIPYQLSAAGNVISVPQPQLAQARLQLGQLQVPGSDVQTAWSQLENAPITASDLAQSTMAMQALELSLQQSIQTMNGIRSAQVFLALPQDTPFLADQPKPSASVVIEADDASAQSQGQAIAALVAGAVPGLAQTGITVETTSGVTVYPAGGALNSGTQLATVAEIEAQAAARIAGLLIPLVGSGNFQTDVSANLDFTQTHLHQITYGPNHLIAHQTSAQSTQYGKSDAAIGIPGALSNEPPPATTATTNPPPAQTAAASATPPLPSQSATNTDQSYVTDESDADITDPDWVVKSLAVSVVLNKSALGSNVTMDQIKTAIASAFAYQKVNVNVLAANFQPPATAAIGAPLLAAAPPLTHALLELMAAAALLFGLAMPAGRRLAGINIQSYLPPPPPRPMPVVLPPRDFSDLRDQAAENIPGVARLLQSWAEDNE